jgi:2-polyprenyl-3-methyl-5-hydroxy-6-metoxy-1,4-benzoquinol methylase
MGDYDPFAKEYSESMGEKGDYYHETQIDPAVYALVGEWAGKVIYDIGCGNGYMARNLALGEAKVFASDLSGELVKEAQAKSVGLDINYAVHDATDFSLYEDEQFDVAIMNMVIHYVQDLDKLFAGISRVLKVGGTLVFSTNHFFRPPQPYSDWVLGEIAGEERLFIKVTDYLSKRATEISSRWDKKAKLIIYNHPLNELVNTMAKNELLTMRFEEPESVGFAKDFPSKLWDSHHIPTFIIVGAQKIKNNH